MERLDDPKISFIIAKARPEVDKIKEALLSSLRDELLETEAIGIFGSLVRGDFHSRSDIDIFVIIDDRIDKDDVDEVWENRIKQALHGFGRDITVIVYTLKGLKGVCNWYVLRLASEGILLYDKGRIKDLFQKIINTAQKIGLVEKLVGNSSIWAMGRKIEIGEIFEIRVED